MAENTGIAWTRWPGFRGATWNPTVGCTRVSPGCAHCYAERWAWRMLQMARGAGRTSHYEGTVHLVGGEPRWTGQVNLAPAHILERPGRTATPTVYFVDSESDLFHPAVSDGRLMRLWDVMARCPQHRFLILTKRAERMASWVLRWMDVEGESREPQLVRGPAETRAAHPSGRGRLFAAMLEELGDPPPGAAFPTFDWAEGPRWWPAALPHVYLGISAEDQARLDERSPHLLALTARGWSTFISYEPALGPLDLTAALRPLPAATGCTWCLRSGVDPFTREPCEVCARGVSWLICGAESGPERRPFEVAWALLARAQCAAARPARRTWASGTARVAFFMKQGSAHKPGQQAGILDELWRCKEFPEAHR